MRVATWNVNSIRQRVDHVVSWLKETGPDVVSHTYFGGVAYWVTSDGEVHRSEGRNFGVDVQAIAS